MSKNKFIKKLLIAGLCAVTATAVIGATACDKGKKPVDPTPPPIDQTTEYTVSFDLDGGTWSNAAGYTVKVEEGGKLPANLATPTNGDKTFGGWYNGTTVIVPGVTVITANMTIKAKWNDPIQAEAKKGVFTVSNTATDSYEADGVIADNDLFTLKAGVAATYANGKDGADLGVTGTNSDGGFTANKAIKQSENVVKGTYQKSLYTVTAKADANVKLLVHFVNDSWNSNRAGAQITYSLGSGAVQKVASVARTADLIGIEVSIPEGETLHVGVNNVSNDGDGKLWLFSVDGVEQQDKVTVNYYNGAETENNLILSQLVSSGATVAAPTENPVTIEYSSKFINWYDAATDGNVYTFGAVTSDVNIYAHYKTSDVTVNYYGADNETVYKTVSAYSGETTTAIDAPAKGDGSEFLYWSATVGGSAYDFTAALSAGELNLYPVYQAAVEGTLVATKDFADASETGSQTFNLVASDESETTLGTVVINVGSYKTNSVTANDQTYTKQIQSGAGNNGVAAAFTLQDGYTYTISLWIGSSSNGSARNVTLKASGESALPEGITATQATGDGTKAMLECKWQGLAAGTYNVEQSGNTIITLIVITAVPVA